VGGSPLELLLRYDGTPFHWHGRGRGLSGGVDCLGLPLCWLHDCAVIPSDVDYQDYGNNFANATEIMRTYANQWTHEIEDIKKLKPSEFAICSFLVGGEARHLGVVHRDIFAHAHMIGGGRVEDWNSLKNKWRNRIDAVFVVTGLFEVSG